MIKVYTELLSAASLWKQTTQLQYYLALRLLDKRGVGWVEVAYAQEVLSKEFGVKPKTVLNNLYKLQNAGFAAINGSRIYYYKQERVLKAICGEDLVTTKAILVGMADLSQGTVTVRAFFETALLAHNNTMSRNTRQKVGGRSPRTQRKYEELVGAEATRNCAVISSVSEYAVQAAKENDIPVFIAMVDGQWMLLRHLPNSYAVPHQATRRYSTLTLRGVPLEQRATAVFFEDVGKALKAWDGGSREVFLKQAYGPWGCLGMICQP